MVGYRQDMGAKEGHPMFLGNRITCQIHRLLYSLATSKSHNAFWQQLGPLRRQAAEKVEVCECAPD